MSISGLQRRGRNTSWRARAAIFIRYQNEPAFPGPLNPSLSLNQWVPGSSPRAPTKQESFLSNIFA